ncbi:MAG TPA: hypothetical protein VF147_01810 [Vicinamibacterales bacterium]
MRSVALALAAACLSIPLLSAESAKIPRDARIAVVAVRDSQAISVCPVIGKHVTTSEVSRRQGFVVVSAPRKQTPVTVYRPRQGVEVLEFREGDVVTAQVTLPDAAAGLRALAPPAADVRAKLELETALTRAGYTVVDTPSAADYVLYLQSTYRPSPVSVRVVSPLVDAPAQAGQLNTPASRPDHIRNQTDQELARRDDRSGQRDRSSPPAPPNASDSDRRWDGGSYDSKAWGGDWRESALATLVPASAYSADASSLLAGSVWQGMAIGRVRASSGEPRLDPAPLGAIADQMRGKGRKHPDYLPLCAVAQK